jgi:phosphohistidine phosphatase SixA
LTPEENPMGCILFRSNGRRQLLGVLLLTASWQLSGATIVLVRHAEKDGTSGDVPLSAQGRQRAAALAGMLVDTGVRTIFTTEFRRTQQTAAPLAQKLKITPVIVPSNSTNLLLKKLKSLAENDVALVVGHNITLPEIVAGLGAGAIPAVFETEFNRMLIVKTGATGKSSVLTLRYTASQP